ncbi:MAG TPA: hypothetical protein VGI66_15020 [Streptosporangiaceae bacterium]|jgi:hypothetical protein
MAGSHLSLIVMPIVIAFVLAFWISLVFYANAHPRKPHPYHSRTDVAGGTFQAVEGGRQLMPIPERPVDVPTPRAATDGTYPESAGTRRSDEARPLADLPPR